MAEKIKIVFLGTGSAIPTARRNHPAVLLQYKSENILIDCGEGTQRQFRKANLNPCKITKILITHWHGDHVLGLPGLFKTLMLNGYNKKLEIYGPKGTKRKIDLYLQLFAHKGSELNLEVKEISKEVFYEDKEFFLECCEMEHEVPCLAYSFILKEKMRIDKEKLSKLKIPNSPLINELLKGKIIKINGKKIDGNKIIYKEETRKITFLMDTRVNEEAVRFAQNSDLLVCESTYSKEDKEIAKERAHLTSEDAATIAKKAKVKKLILTHLSQRYDEIPKLIEGEAKKIFKETKVVEDLERIEIN